MASGVIIYGKIFRIEVLESVSFVHVRMYIATQLQLYSTHDHMQYMMLGGYYLVATCLLIFCLFTFTL